MDDVSSHAHSTELDKRFESAVHNMVLLPQIGNYDNLNYVYLSKFARQFFIF